MKINSMIRSYSRGITVILAATIFLFLGSYLHVTSPDPPLAIDYVVISLFLLVATAIFAGIGFLTEEDEG